jgi:ABC-type multidrug transport system fused ATPase/permease subunit
MLTRLLRAYLRPYAGQVAIVVTLLVAQTVGNLYLPNLNGDIINNGVVKDDVRYIWTTGAVMLGITVAVGAVAVIAVYWASRVAMGTGADLRAAVFTRGAASPGAPLSRRAGAGDDVPPGCPRRA